MNWGSRKVKNAEADGASFAYPFSLTEPNLRQAMTDRRYTDGSHPEAASWRGMVSQGWSTLYPDGSLRGDHTDNLPRHQGADGHIYASDGTVVARNLTQGRGDPIPPSGPWHGNTKDDGSGGLLPSDSSGSPDYRYLAQPLAFRNDASNGTGNAPRVNLLAQASGPGGGGGNHYDPNQPRDEHGRWVSEGGEGGSTPPAPDPGEPPQLPGSNMPVIRPPNVDPNMPVITDPFPMRTKGAYLDPYGNIITEGRNPKNGLLLPPIKGPY
jgi:hypothetical protein